VKNITTDAFGAIFLWGMLEAFPNRMSALKMFNASRSGRMMILLKEDFKP